MQSGVTLPEGVDTDAAKAALTYYTNFEKVDGVWNTTMPESIDAFASQQAAMTFGTSQDILKVLEINPTMQLGVLPVPQLPDFSGGTTSDTWANFWVESVSADASDAEQKAAWDFLEWMSQPDQQKLLYTESSKGKRFGFIPGNREVQEEVLKNEYLKNIVRQAVYSRTSIISDKAGNDNYTEIIKSLIRNIEDRDNLTDTKEAYLELLNSR